MEKVSDRSANVIGSVAPKSTAQAVWQCTENVRETKGQPANIPAPRRPERTRARRAIGDARASVPSATASGSKTSSVRAGVGSLTTLRRARAGVGSSAERVRVGEKGRCSCGLRTRRRARENSNERSARTASAYREPHQVSEVSSLWPNGRKRAREFGKMDPYLRYKD